MFTLYKTTIFHPFLHFQILIPTNDTLPPPFSHHHPPPHHHHHHHHSPPHHRHSHNHNHNHLQRPTLMHHVRRMRKPMSTTIPIPTTTITTTTRHNKLPTTTIHTHHKPTSNHPFSSQFPILLPTTVTNTWCWWRWWWRWWRWLRVPNATTA